MSRAASRISRQVDNSVRVLNYSGSGIEMTFTQGEDACLASLVPPLPVSGVDAAPALVVGGSLADVVEDQFAGTFAAKGLGSVAFFPRIAQLRCEPSARTPASFRRNRFWPILRALEERGATRILAPFPLGVEGTTACINAAANSFGISIDTVLGVTKSARAGGCRSTGSSPCNCALLRLTTDGCSQ